MRKLRLVLTDNCNFNCPCCYNEGNKSKNKNNHIDYKLIKKFLYMTKGEYKTVVLTGGEPLLYKKINKLVRILKKLGMEIQLTSNGSLLNRVKPSILKKIDNINISFDKIDPNSFRYKCKTSVTMFENVKKNIIDCSKKYNNVILNTVFDENITEKEVFQLLDFVKENRLNAIKFIPLLDNKEDKCLQKLQTILFEKFNLNNDISSKNYLIDKYNQDGYNVFILKQYCNNSCEECRQNSFVRINWDGKIYPCRKNLNRFLKLEDLVKEKNNKNIVDKIEEVFGEN